METTYLPATPEPGAPTEPLITPGTVTAIASGAIALAVAFGVNLTEAQTGAILAVVAVVAPLIVMFISRRKAFAPATVRAMVVEAAASGVVNTTPQTVPAEGEGLSAPRTVTPPSEGDNLRKL